MADWKTNKDLIQKLYIAFYGRPADPGGLRYWASQLPDNAALDSKATMELIKKFINSDEAQARFGKLDLKSTINRVFYNAYQIDISPDKVDWYIQTYNDIETIIAVILDLGYQDLQTTLNKKLQYANWFTELIDPNGDGIANDDSSGNKFLTTFKGITDAEDPGFILNTDTEKTKDDILLFIADHIADEGDEIQKIKIEKETNQRKQLDEMQNQLQQLTFEKQQLQNEYTLLQQQNQQLQQQNQQFQQQIQQFQQQIQQLQQQNQQLQEQLQQNQQNQNSQETNPNPDPNPNPESNPEPDPNPNPNPDPNPDPNPEPNPNPDSEIHLYQHLVPSGYNIVEVSSFFGFGTEGNDFIWVQTTNSNVIEIWANDGNDIIYANNAPSMIYSGHGNDIIYASVGNDYVDGFSGNDSIVGGAGDDTLIGSAGSDTLTGGDGNDTFIFNVLFNELDQINDFTSNDIIAFKFTKYWLGNMLEETPEGLKLKAVTQSGLTLVNQNSQIPLVPESSLPNLLNDLDSQYERVSAIAFTFSDSMLKLVIFSDSEPYDLGGANYSALDYVKVIGDAPESILVYWTV